MALRMSGLGGSCGCTRKHLRTANLNIYHRWKDKSLLPNDLIFELQYVIITLSLVAFTELIFSQLSREVRDLNEPSNHTLMVVIPALNILST